MDKKEAANWTRHFDSMLWQVTSIFATAIGALIAYTYSHYDMAIALAGLAFTVIPIYFGASFRELRRRVNKFLDPELKSALSEGRSLHQWKLFVLIFIIFQWLWVFLLIRNNNSLWWLWIIIGCIILLITIWLASIGNVTIQKSDEKKPHRIQSGSSRTGTRVNKRSKG